MGLKVGDVFRLNNKTPVDKIFRGKLMKITKKIKRDGVTLLKVDIGGRGGVSIYNDEVPSYSRPATKKEIKNYDEYVLEESI